jgi:two-component system CheB/CheR fusion protein
LRDFETVDNHWRVYRKFSDVRTPVELRFRKSEGVPARVLPAPGAQTTRWSLAQLLGTYDALLDDYMPPSLLLTEHGEVVHAFRGASKFLKLRDGRQSLDVLDTIDSELKMVLVGGIKRALRESNAIVFVGVRVRESDGESGYRVTIRRVAARTQSARHVLVTFETDEVVPQRRSETEIDVSQMSRDEVVALETELTYTKENLQAAIEELETGNEELQAANEELLASNEELQSTNEELQSVNEELYTVNAEYQRKIGELTELTNDIDNLLASTEMGTIFLDPQLRIRKLTPRIADTFNLLPQDVGRPLEAFTHTIDHPALMDDLKSVLAGAEPIEREIRDRRGKSYILRVLPYRAKGTTQGVVLTLLDMTNLKKAEDELFHERHLLNSLMLSVPDAIYFRDANGRFIRVNDAMARWLGLASPQDALGKTTYEVCDREIAASLHDEDVRVVQSGEPQLYRLERHTRAGEEEWHVVTRLPLRDPRGHVVGVIGIYRNVTQLKRAEQRVHEAVQRRDQFLAMLSHELRNPLGAIVTATALLAKRAKNDGDEMRLVSIVDRQSQQMSHLLDDLLEASRVTQNKIELRRQVLDLGAVVREAAEAARGMTESRGVTLEADIAAEPIWVDGDASRLQQLQMNMLSNAAKYTPRGGHIRLSAGRDGDYAVIRVKDDGVGIPPDMLDAVFDLFVQSHSTLDRADGGLGLGLTLVRSLVQMHGGTVVANSDGPGKGSEFVVRLPIAKAPEEDVAPSRGIAWPTDARGRVVIVEDNVDSREMLKEMLSIAGFECHAVEDATRALVLLGRVKPNVAIVDVGLPGMDGFELARRIRTDATNSQMYLVALTGYGQAADRARALDAGFDEHLVKPVSPESLMRLLARGRDATN